MSEAGTTYATIEEYLHALERRQELEKAPTAALFMLGSYDMMHLQYGGHPWLTRVRCELPTRPLGPSGEEEAVRATFIGANSREDASHYESFVKAMALIDVTRCVHLKAAGLKESSRALAHLEQSDIIVLGDGPHVREAWYNIGDGCLIGLLDRIKWRYYCGAILLGVGTGAMLLGKLWWVGDPAQELEARKRGYAMARNKEEEEADRAKWGDVTYFSGKAMEIVPAWFSTSVEQSESLATVQGAVAAAITLPKLGAAIFNTDGTLEPCNSILYEHLYDWKTEEVKCSLLQPPDEKTNILKCAEYVERRQAKLRAKRIARGLPADAPISLDDEEEDDDEDDEEEDIDHEAQREAERELLSSRHDPMGDVKRRRRQEAEVKREKGTNLFKQGDFAGALEAFDGAITASADDSRAHLNRAAALLKLNMPRRAVLAADRSLHLCAGGEAKAWYRRAAAWLDCGEFNECIADCEYAKRLEPSDKAIVALRKKAEEEREGATFAFARDQKRVEKLREQLEDPKLSAADKAMIQAANAGTSGDWREGVANLDACRTVLAIEEFTGHTIELLDGSLTLQWVANRKKGEEEGRQEVIAPAMLDQRALFCIEEATKRRTLSALSIRGCLLGSWGAAFIARGARLEGAGLEVLSLVNCRLRAEGATAVASLLSRGSKLIELDLSGNQIGDEGANEVAKQLAGNEYLEKLGLARNRITSKRMGVLAKSVEAHPALRVLELSHNLVTYAGVCHLASALRESESLQHVSIAHNKCRADAVYRLASVCSGHPSISTLDCRGVPLRKADRRKLEAHTRFTRLEIWIDQPPKEAAEAEAKEKKEPSAAQPKDRPPGSVGSKGAPTSDMDIEEWVATFSQYGFY